MAWVADEADRCPGCGHHRDESMAEGADQDYDAEPVVCHACATTSRAQESWSKQGGESHGTFWVNRRKGGDE